MKRHAANILTGCRALCGVALLFFPAFSVGFYVPYSLGGFSDMVDGAVARRTGGESEFGARLDTVADLVFVAAVLVKLLPALRLPVWVLVWIAAIAVIKLSNLVSGFVLERRFVALHTVMNKIAGILLFLLPFTLSFVDIRYSAAAVCSVATFAAVQDGHFIRSGRT